MNKKYEEIVEELKLNDDFKTIITDHLKWLIENEVTTFIELWNTYKEDYLENQIHLNDRETVNDFYNYDVIEALEDLKHVNDYKYSDNFVQFCPLRSFDVLDLDSDELEDLCDYIIEFPRYFSEIDLEEVYKSYKEDEE